MTKDNKAFYRKFILEYNSNKNKSQIMKDALNINLKTNIPINIISDILTLKVEINDQDLGVLYGILETISPKSIECAFSNMEVKAFKNYKYQNTSMDFPIVFDAIEIDEYKQYSCRISVEELMRLRDAQLINYNENTQRTLKHIVNGDVEYYKIALNRRAVNNIINSFDNGLYIPNTLTFNMGEDTDFEFINGKLIIKSLTHFDILDGYHRYIAISNKYTKEPFDFNMELRIVSFSEDRARQFIWQEDQKTKMSKIDSSSFNQNNYGNRLAKDLNSNILYSGMVKQNGKIKDTYFSRVVDFIFFHMKDKRYKISDYISVKNKLIKQFEQLANENPDVLNMDWSEEFIIATLVCFEQDIVDYTTINRIATYAEENNLIRKNMINKIDINRIKKLLREEN